MINGLSQFANIVATHKLSATSGTMAEPLTKQSPAVSEFLAEVQKTPAERIQEAVLKQMGVTPEEYAEMSGEEKSAIDEAIKDAIIEQVKDGTLAAEGNYTDILA